MIIEDVDYLRELRQIRIFPGAARAMKALKEGGFKVIVVSNQSGVARGYLSLAQLGRIHRELKKRLARTGAQWDALYFSPHAADSRHPWRKPGTGMLKAARRRFNLDLKSSYLVGDKTGDVKTALNAGCVPVLVRTGKGGRDGEYPKAKPHRIVKDLAAAARWILSR